jgi:hypothetical protein
MKNPASLLEGAGGVLSLNLRTAHEAEEPPASILCQRMTLANNLRYVLRICARLLLRLDPVESATHNNIRQSAGFAHCRSIYPWLPRLTV